MTENNLDIECGVCGIRSKNFEGVCLDCHIESQSIGMRGHKPIIIVVNGIIAAGKSKYIEMLKTDLTKRGYKVVVVPEPIEKWRETGFFDKYGKNPEIYAFAFQVQAFVDRVNYNIKAYEDHGDQVDIYLLDRSPASDPIFMEAQHAAKYIDDTMLESYRDWCDLWVKSMPYIPDLFIYLRPSIEETMNRLHKRNRPGEEAITLDYQLDLLNRHDKIFGDKEVNIPGVGKRRSITIKNETNYLKSDDNIDRNTLVKQIEILYVKVIKERRS